ncbi:MAG: metallophosphoesterase [Polyangiaceae bacterium]|nr:metallophosphoesterase [Polyangiaceae bacterium]
MAPAASMLRIACALVLCALAGCHCEPRSGTARGGATTTAATAGLAAEPPEDASPAQVLAPAPRVRHGGMDLSFLVTADTHLGYGDDEALNVRAIAAMNDMAGKPFPAAAGGALGEPAGVLVAGDLTDGGKPEEWERFEALYGLTGKEGVLHYPVFEVLGNHDRAGGTFVERQIARRHGARRYAWDWQDVHFVCFGEAPDENDIVWLRDELRRLGKDIGIVLLFHFPLTGPYSHGWWWEDRHRAALRDLLDGYPVLGIFHGHYHANGSYRWNGLDAYNPGSVRHGGRGFIAVRIEDTRMTVAEWSYKLGGFTWWHQKPIFGAPGKEQRVLTGAVIGQPGWDRARE